MGAVEGDYMTQLLICPGSRIGINIEKPWYLSFYFDLIDMHYV